MRFPFPAKVFVAISWTTEAGVKTVVLNHQVGGQTQSLAYPVTAFIQRVRSGFSGEVIVGQDLMVL